MLEHRLRRDRGDTLIEVIFAIAIFAMVMVGTIILMNQGTAAGRRALEISLVRQQIDGQAETLRYLHDAYSAVYQPGVPIDPSTPAGKWKSLVAQPYVASTAVTPFITAATTCPTLLSGRYFIMNPADATYNDTQSLFHDASTYSNVEWNPTTKALAAANGMWIEAVESAKTNGVSYIDFHIRACWFSSGSNAPMMIGTIVRLYDKS